MGAGAGVGAGVVEFPVKFAAGLGVPTRVVMVFQAASRLPGQSRQVSRQASLSFAKLRQAPPSLANPSRVKLRQAQSHQAKPSKAVAQPRLCPPPAPVDPNLFGRVRCTATAVDNI